MSVAASRDAISPELEREPLTPEAQAHPRDNLLMQLTHETHQRRAHETKYRCCHDARVTNPLNCCLFSSFYLQFYSITIGSSDRRVSDFRRRANSIDFRPRWALWGISQGLVLNYLISASKTLHGAGKLQERLRESSRHTLRDRHRATLVGSFPHERSRGRWARATRQESRPHQCPTKSQSSHTSAKARQKAIFPNTVSRFFLFCPLPPFLK